MWDHKHDYLGDHNKPKDYIGALEDLHTLQILRKNAIGVIICQFISSLSIPLLVVLITNVLSTSFYVCLAVLAIPAKIIALLLSIANLIKMNQMKNANLKRKVLTIGVIDFLLVFFTFLWAVITSAVLLSKLKTLRLQQEEIINFTLSQLSQIKQN
ncbi:hypothetical protein [Ureaplasma ceti]|uniref:Uncharacterized protein n=1 Tax=Ureaplasma ceti TaxID=3119530 RepID=A0ABP9U4K1_9BACT